MDTYSSNAATAKNAPRQLAGGMAIALVLALVSAGALYSSAAEARWGGHGHGGRIAGAVAGGLVLGALVARPAYAYARPVYYAPPAYYPPPVYYPPPAYYPPTPAYYPPAPAVSYATPPAYAGQPAYAVPPAVSLSVEERLRRLQSLCGQGLLSAPECTAKRQEILRLM